MGVEQPPRHERVGRTLNEGGSAPRPPSGAISGLVRLGAIALVLFVVLRVCVACNLSNFLGDDFSGANERYRREVESVLSVDSNGRVLAEGDVSMLGQSCDISEASCRVILVVGGVVVSVYYRANSDGGACRNSNADALVEKLGIGDRVRVYGQYYQIGNISICDDQDYYIEAIGE